MLYSSPWWWRFVIDVGCQSSPSRMTARRIRGTTGLPHGVFADIKDSFLLTTQYPSRHVDFYPLPFGEHAGASLPPATLDEDLTCHLPLGHGHGWLLYLPLMAAAFLTLPDDLYTPSNLDNIQLITQYETVAEVTNAGKTHDNNDLVATLGFSMDAASLPGHGPSSRLLLLFRPPLLGRATAHHSGRPIHIGTQQPLIEQIPDDQF